MVSGDGDSNSVVTERKIKGVRVSVHHDKIGWFFYHHANSWGVSANDPQESYVTLFYTAAPDGPGIAVGMVPLHNVLAIRMVYEGESIDG